MNEIAEPPMSMVAGYSDLRTSQQIAQLADALAMAQGEMEMPDKDREVSVKSEKGNYKFKYATMDNIVTKTRPALARHGLAVIQPVISLAGKPVVLTRLMHKSGEWLESCMAIHVGGNNNPQAFGSALTYARRYSYSALLGIVTDEDDDGNAAAGNTIEDRRGHNDHGPARPFGFLTEKGGVVWSPSAVAWVKEWDNRVSTWVKIDKRHIVEEAWAANRDLVGATRIADEHAVEEVERLVKLALNPPKSQDTVAGSVSQDSVPPGPTRDAIPLYTADATTVIARKKDQYTAERVWLSWFRQSLAKLESHAGVNSWLDKNDASFAFVRQTWPDVGRAADTSVEEKRGALDGFPDTSKQAGGK